MQLQKYLRYFLFIFAICLAFPLDGAALSKKIISLNEQIAAQLQEIADEAAHPGASKNSLSIRINRLGELLKSMEGNLRHNLKRCESTPTPPDPSAAINNLITLINNYKGNEETKKEYFKIKKSIEEYTKKINELEKVKKRADIVRKLIISGKAGEGTVNIIEPTGPIGIVIQLLRKWYYDFKRKVTTGDRLPAGKQGNPIDLIDGVQFKDVYPGYESSQKYIKNRKNEYGGKGEDFNQFCIKKWEFEYSRTYDPASFIGWYDQDLKLWKQSYILKYVDQDIAWLKDKLKECEKEFKKIKERLDNEKGDFEGLLLQLNTFLKMTLDWQRFEKMESAIEVSVVDDVSSQDINNVSVTLSSPNGTVTQNGTPIEFEKLPNGTYTVEARARGYVTHSQSVTITKCGDYRVDIRLKLSPRIRIVGIVDHHTNQPINNPMDVSITDASTGGQVGRVTYSGGTREFTVDPGSYEIRATDPNNRLQLERPVRLNVDPGDVIDVTLRMRLRSKFVFVIEVFDKRSGLKIDPPAGQAPVPSATLEPLDGQPQPSGPTYKGNGEIHFDFVRLGRYQYKANFCGWNYQEGVLTVVPANITGPRVAKQIRLQPTSIDSYTVRVREHGNRLVLGFNATVTGLGPRSGEAMSVVYGRDPANPNYAPAYGSFRIQGPVYSGRYRIMILHPCYKLYTRDVWLVFCGNKKFAFTPQEFHLKPDPEYAQARLLAGRAIDLTREINSEGRTILDLYDTLKIRHGELKRAIDEFKQNYQGSNLNKQKRQKAREAHADLKERLGRYQPRVRELKNKVVDFNKKVKERKGLIEQLKSFRAELDCLKNDPLFKDDLRLLSQNTTQPPEDVESLFEPPLSLPELPNFAQIEKCEAALAEAQGLLPGDISGAQKLLTKVENECQRLTEEIDQGIASLRAEIERLILEQLETVRTQLAACQFEAAKKSIAKLPAGTVREQGNADYRKAVEGEKRSTTLQEQAQNQAGECRYTNALVKLNEAMDYAICSNTRDKINQQISDYNKAQQYEKRTLQIYSEVTTAYENCQYDLALKKLNEARNYTRCTRYRQSLDSKIAIINKAKKYEAGTLALINEVKKAYSSCRYTEALSKMREAMARTSCGRYRNWLNKNLPVVQSANAHENKTRQLYEAAQKNLANCELDQARNKLNRALNHTRCEIYREKIKKKIATVNKTDIDVNKAKSLFEKAKQEYSACRYQETLATLNQALAFAPCGELGKTLKEKIKKINATIKKEAKSQALYNEANAYYKRCEFANARQKLTQAVEQSPCRSRRQNLSQKFSKLDNAQKNLEAVKREHSQIISRLQTALASKDCSIDQHQKDLARLSQLEQGSCKDKLDLTASSRLSSGISQLAKSCKAKTPTTSEKVWTLVETKLNPHNWPANTKRDKKAANSYIDNWNISAGGLKHHFEWWQWGGLATRADFNGTYQAPPATLRPGQTFTLSLSASAARKENNKSAATLWLGYGIHGLHGFKVTGKCRIGAGNVSSHEWRPSDSGQCTFAVPDSSDDEFTIFAFVGGKGSAVNWKYKRKGSASD